MLPYAYWLKVTGFGENANNGAAAAMVYETVATTDAPLSPVTVTVAVYVPTASDVVVGFTCRVAGVVTPVPAVWRRMLCARKPGGRLITTAPNPLSLTFAANQALAEDGVIVATRLPTCFEVFVDVMLR